MIYRLFKTPKSICLIISCFLFIGFGRAESVPDSVLFNRAMTMGLTNADSAVKLLDKLISKELNRENTANLCKYYNKKGRILLNNSQFEESLASLLKAQQIAKELNSKVFSFEVDLNLMHYYTRIYNIKNATQYFNRLKIDLKSIEDSNLKSFALNNFGNYFIELYYNTSSHPAHIDSAIFYFKESLEISEAIHDAEKTIANHTSLGISYYNKGDYERAIYHYNKAIDLIGVDGDKIGMANLLSNLGSVYFDLEQYEKSIDYYEKAIDLFKLQKNFGIPVNMYFILSEAFAYNQQFEEAYHAQQKGMVIYDSIFTIDKEKVINEILTKYETEKLENEVAEKKFQINELAYKSKNRKITIIAMASALFLILIIFLMRLRATKLKEIIFQKEVDLKNKEIDKLLKEQELKSLAAMLEGQDKERQRIGNDLHDRIGGLLSTVKAYFQTLEDKIEKLEEATQERYQKANDLLNMAVNEVRDISHNLSNGILKNFGLKAALKDMKNTIELTEKVKVELTFSGVVESMDMSAELEIYQMIQELFSNVLKHSKAKTVDLQLNYFDNNLNIIFEDDGIGFDTTKGSKGLGLLNIEARVKNLNGNLNIDSQIGRGSIFIIDIPIP